MATNTFLLRNQLFMASTTEKIKCVSAPTAKFNKVGPVAVGVYSKRPATAKSGAKYSQAAKVLDYFLVEKRANMLSSPTQIYGEYTASDGSIYRFTCDGKTALYEKSALTGRHACIPFIMYAIRNGSELTETIDAFKASTEQFLTRGDCEPKPVLHFCDSIYYEFAHAITGECVSEENALPLETVEAGIRSGYLQSTDLLMTVPDLPEITIKVETKKKKERKASAKSLYKDICNGKSVIPYEWSEEQKTKIPKLATLEDYVPIPQLFSTLSKIKKRAENVITRLDSGVDPIEAIGKDYVNFFIVGKPGTGKTTLAYALGAALGMPTYTVPLTKNTEEDTFQGMVKVIDGKLTSVTPDFLKAYTEGGIIILEEINLADPAVVMGAIGQSVEFPFVLLKDGYKPVRRHPLCVIIGTMNIGTYGSKGVNQALSSRFKQTYSLNDPTKADFVNILNKTNPDKALCEWVYTAYDKILGYLRTPAVNADDVCMNITLRSCLGALENIEEGEDCKTAIKNTLIGKIAEIDLELADKTYTNAVAPLPDIY